MKFRYIVVLIVLALQLGLLRAGNNEWTRVALPDGAHGTLVLFSDPRDPNALYASSTGDETHRAPGLWKTSDGGATWRQVTFSPTPAFVSALAFDPQNISSIYAATWGRGIFKSVDAGESWEATGRTNAYVGSLAIDPQNHNIVYAFDAAGSSLSPDSGIYKTTDGGAHWTNLGRPGPLAWSIETLAIDPKDSSTLYVGDGCCSTSGLYKTTDGARTWTEVREMENCYMVDVVIVAHDSSTQYAGGSCDRDQFISQVFKSTDSGATWTAMNSGLPENRANIWGLVVDPEHPQILYAAFGRVGVFRSVDGGANWITFNTGLVNTNVSSLALAPGPSNVVYAWTRDGLFKITDSSQLATNVTFDPSSVRLGSSFTATFSGINLTGETYFDVRFRSPDSGTDQVALNWQQGSTATHRVPLDTAPGTWSMNGVRAHQAVDEHNADYLPVAATLMVNPVAVTEVRLDATGIRPGGSLTATFSGTNLTDDTYFDIRFRSPGSATGQVALNWQRGRSAGHNIPIDTATGTWAIVGVWAHQLPNDHSSDFSPVSATFAVFP